MIQTWGNTVSRKMWEGERPTRFRSLNFAHAIDLLIALNAAESLQDLSLLKSVGFHELMGERRGLWAMAVNGSRRICFEFRNGNAFSVEDVNCHRG